MILSLFVYFKVYIKSFVKIFKYYVRLIKSKKLFVLKKNFKINYFLFLNKWNKIFIFTENFIMLSFYINLLYLKV